MPWIHSFEIQCYALTEVLLADILRKKNIGEAKLFLSGAIAGFALEERFSLETLYQTFNLLLQ